MIDTEEKRQELHSTKEERDYYKEKFFAVAWYVQTDNSIVPETFIEIENATDEQIKQLGFFNIGKIKNRLGD